MTVFPLEEFEDLSSKVFSGVALHSTAHHSMFDRLAQDTYFVRISYPVIVESSKDICVNFIFDFHLLVATCFLQQWPQVHNRFQLCRHTVEWDSNHSMLQHLPPGRDMM